MTLHREKSISPRSNVRIFLALIIFFSGLARAGVALSADNPQGNVVGSSKIVEALTLKTIEHIDRTYTLRDQIEAQKFSKQLEPLQKEWKDLVAQIAKNENTLRARRAVDPEVAQAALDAIRWNKWIHFAGPSRPPGACDLIDREWHGPEKDQGETGDTCTVYTVTALLEAAWYRAYGETITLSEGSYERQRVKALLSKGGENAVNKMHIKANTSLILGMAKRGFLCSEDTYATPRNKLEGFMSDEFRRGMGPAEMKSIIGKRFALWTEVFGSDKSASVQKCLNEGEKISEKVKEFQFCSVKNSFIDSILSLRIPVGVTLPVDEFTRVGKSPNYHAVVLKRNVKDSYDFRTSGGRGLNIKKCIPKTSVQTQGRGVYEDPNISVGRASLILTPGDLALIQAKFPKITPAELGCKKDSDS